MSGAINLCTYEDRASDFGTLQVLVKSVEKYIPAAVIHVPTERVDPVATSWLCAQKNVKLRPDIMLSGLSGWDVKSSIVKGLLEAGLERVVWLDADIVLTQPPIKLLEYYSSDKLILCEEGYRGANVGTICRAKELGLSVGRELGFTVNSCVLGASATHLGLINEWSNLCGSPEYRIYQTMPQSERPFYCHGDQDLLTGLLGSSKFDDIDFFLLRSGIDVIHCISSVEYGLWDRIRALIGSDPPISHAQQLKFWRNTDTGHVSNRVKSTMYYLGALEFVKYTDQSFQRAFENIGRPVLYEQLKCQPSLLGIADGALGSTRYLASRLKRTAMAIMS